MDEYSTKGLDAAAKISMTTIPMAGYLVDVYGLDELPSEQNTPITCLWLLHPRTRTRARMADIACRTIDAWRSSSPQPQKRGLVALSFDMPNHGTRMVSELANQAWDTGNERHAIDMAGIVRRGVSDMSGLMDLVAGYLGRKVVDGHVCLGWSLGGHSAWQAWFGEERIDAAVVVVGCPDYIGLMTSRAAESKLDAGQTLLGSKYFPNDLLRLLAQHDPKSIMLGVSTTPLPQPPLSIPEKTHLREIFDARIRGKRLLACAGGADKLVPYKRSQPLLAVLKDATDGWYRDGDVLVDDRVYEGVGHKFSAEMVRDAVRFLVKAVGEGPRGKREEKSRI